jgi:putative DNA primase/helicase
MTQPAFDNDDGGSVHDDRKVARLRPQIELTNEIHVVTDQAIRSVSGEPDVFQRDGKLVRVIRVAKASDIGKSKAETRRMSCLEGSPILRPMCVPIMRETMVRCASWVKTVKKTQVSTLPSDAITNSVLARGEYPNIRTIVGISESPMFVPSGEVFDRPGYDDETGYIYAPTCDFPKIRQEPTQVNASKALAELTDVFADFPWSTPADSMVAIALVLTLIGRAAITGNIPCFVINANSPGAGKTKVVDTAAIIATGRRSPKMTFPSGNDAELEKILSSFALRGSSLAVFDNLDAPLKGASLDKVLTCGGETQMRVLGRNDTPELTWRCVIGATGNNVEVDGDTARRCIMGRLDSPLEDPQSRTDVRHDPLEDWVEENRPRLVVAALTILRAWHCAGRPRCNCQKWGSFEEWARVVPPAIVFAGGADPMECLFTSSGEESSEKSARRTLLNEWPKLSRDGAKVKWVIDQLYPPELKGHSPNDEWSTLREAIETLSGCQAGKVPSSRDLANAFRHMKGLNIGGRKLVPVHYANSRESASWIVVDSSHKGNRYVIEEPPPPEPDEGLYDT